MRNVILSLFFILMAFDAHAVSISSLLETNSAGELEKQTIVRCNAADAELCQNLCSDSNTCIQPEELCTDCVGLKNQTLRTAFTDLPYLYRRSNKKLSSQELLRFLQRTDHMLLNYDSYLNIFNANKKDQIKDQFLAFCRIQTGPNVFDNISEALLIVSLSENQQPDQFVGILCTNQKSETSIFPLAFNPEYSKQPIEYFNSIINNEDGLKLKLSLELSLKP